MEHPMTKTGYAKDHIEGMGKAILIAVMETGMADTAHELMEVARQQDEAERRRPQPRGRDWQGFIARRSDRHKRKK